MSDLIYSVNDLLCNIDGFLKVHGATCFKIPEYQRGYKWKAESVTQLLNDINNFQSGGDKFYCLQNITIVRTTDEKKQVCFNVVDGQQRLTTLVIILSYLEIIETDFEELNYSVREKTHEFLIDFIVKRKIWEVSADKEFDSLIKKIEDYNHQDIFYIFQAAKTIEAWFEEKQTEKPKDENAQFDKQYFTEKLLKHVKLIVNSVNGSHEEKIFGNLNSKRVPLDGSDLIRAILITRAAREECDGTDIKDIVRINERRVRIGWELDEINRWWNKENVKGYFNSFKSIKGESNTQPSFNMDNGINNLYALYSEIKGERNLNFSTFENGQNGNDDKSDDHLEMYHEILDLHKTLQDWYSDRELYHLLGYYFINRSAKEFKAVYDLWKMTGKDRNDFIKDIKSKIKLKAFEEDKEGEESGLNSTLDNIKNNKYDWYNNGKLSKVLILLDIIDLSKIEKNNPVFCKLDFPSSANIIPQSCKENSPVMQF